MSAPARSITRADFVLAPFMASRNDRAAWQLFNTLLPYLLLWWMTLRAAAVSLWLLPILILLLSLFSVRCFSLMHDCGHQSLFRSRWLNRTFGFLLGLVNAVPQLAGHGIMLITTRPTATGSATAASWMCSVLTNSVA